MKQVWKILVANFKYCYPDTINLNISYSCPFGQVFVLHRSDHCSVNICMSTLTYFFKSSVMLCWESTDILEECRYASKDRTLHNHHCKNCKSHNIFFRKPISEIFWTHILYFSILLHSFNTEYLFSCPSMQHIHFLNSIKTCFGLARTSGGEYSITDDGRVRPKHVLMKFRKWMCCIDGQENKYSGHSWISSISCTDKPVVINGFVSYHSSHLLCRIWGSGMVVMNAAIFWDIAL
jgi:hypothetical protein